MNWCNLFALLIFAPKTQSFIEIEKHIRADLKKISTAVILSENRIDFKTIPESPYMVISSKLVNIVLSTPFVVFVLDFHQNKETLSILLVRNHNIKILVLYSRPENPVTLKEIRTITKLDVVIICTESGNSTLFKYPISCNRNLKCVFRRRTMRVGFTSTPPSLNMGETWELRKAANDPIPPFRLNLSNPPQNYFSGIEAELMELLVDRYELSVEMISPPDFEYGSYDDTNGSFTGKFSLLQNGHVDVVVGSITGNSERGVVGKYSPMLFTSNFVLISQNPKVLPEWDAAFRPFPALGWFILFISITFVAPISFYITKSHNSILGVSTEGKESVWTYVAHASATLLVEPWPKPPGGPAALIVSTWLLACLILQSIYASNFTVQQSFPNERQQIRTLDDVYRNKRRLVVYPGSTVELLLKSSRDSNMRRIHRRALTVRLTFPEQFEYMDRGYVLATVLDNFLYRRSLLLHHEEYEKYYVSDIPLLTTFSSWLYPEDDAELPTAVNTLILRAASNGLLSKWYSDMMRQFDGKGALKGSTFRKQIQVALDKKDAAIKLSELEGVFIFWIFGIATASAVFFAEVGLRGFQKGVNKIKQVKKSKVKPYRYLK